MTDKCKSCDFFFEFSEEQNGHKGLCDNRSRWIESVDVTDCDEHHTNTNPLIWYNMEDSEYQPIERNKMSNDNVINLHKKPKVYKHTDVMNHLNDSSPYGLEFEKGGHKYYIISKEESESNNANIIGMMTGVDVLTGGDYENGSCIDEVSDKPNDVLASFVMRNNLEGIMDYGVSIPNFAIYFFDEMFLANEEIKNPVVTAEGVPEGSMVNYETPEIH